MDAASAFRDEAFAKPLTLLFPLIPAKAGIQPAVLNFTSVLSAGLTQRAKKKSNYPFPDDFGFQVRSPRLNALSAAET